ncbi:myo-inosose-2 dehydratase [Solimonas terrae]|uniref:Myo-inosose-2 dehydratase n=1 Tax=Solimonas terrae TaxID=1396819 RepID=A0A6M2BKH8_9GAMM|nr:myo-inosose-2 dehydratase [Solimonas terrae]NGY03266.1 myo-inosose-2 dehydratase [Solimonas terrae]
MPTITHDDAIRIGINPISWSNDDLPALGGETPLATALSEGARIGYRGFELNGKFPPDSAGVGRVLAEHGLQLVSGWYSGELATRSAEDEIAAIASHVRKMADNGADRLVYGEVANAIQGKRVPLLQRPRFHTDAAWRTYAGKLDRLAAYTASQGVKLCYHHHMGAYIESPADIDRLMALTTDDVGLLFDSGHCCLGGGDPLTVLSRHIDRVAHVHFKDVRRDVAAMARNAQWSFPDCIVNGAFTVPGDGDLDFAAMLEVLIRHDYRGWLVVEAEQDPAVAPSYLYARKGFDTVQRLLHAARARIASS